MVDEVLINCGVVCGRPRLAAGKRRRSEKTWLATLVTPNPKVSKLHGDPLTLRTSAKRRQLTSQQCGAIHEHFPEVG